MFYFNYTRLQRQHGQEPGAWVLLTRAGEAHQDQEVRKTHQAEENLSLAKSAHPALPSGRKLRILYDATSQGAWPWDLPGWSWLI